MRVTVTGVTFFITIQRDYAKVQIQIKPKCKMILCQSAKWWKISHTGTGRISRMKMRPMSLFESNESSGEVSLKALFEQDYNIRGGSR